MTPKGTLLIIGGHENKGEAAESKASGESLHLDMKRQAVSHFEILGRLISTIPRAHHIIEIIAAASSIPGEMEAMYTDAYKKAGFTHVGFIKIATPADAALEACTKRVKGAHAVFFTGGDQKKLINLVAGSALLTAIVNKYHADEHFIVGGTSAGAMAMPETIIAGGAIREALYQGDIKMALGFALIKDVIVDTHFIKRGRFARLAHAVALNPGCLGIGLGEDTALVITAGNRATCIGTGMVILIDGRRLGTTNASIAAGDTPIYMEHLQVSIIAEGNCYLLQERKMEPQTED